jgi:hypothetical protein
MADVHVPEPLSFSYTFQFPDGSEKRFTVRLNARTLELLTNPKTVKPEWTRLTYHQCDNCPLSREIERCPVAANLSQVVEAFKDATSYERSLVTVQTTQRTFRQETSLQKGLSSIIGIYTVTSGCPILDKLRPMVRFHLPFASGEETLYRAVAMHLVGQYFLMKKGKTPDWELRELSKTYEAISHVDRGLSERMAHASREDANVNSVLILSAFSQEILYQIEEGLTDLEYLFSGYLGGLSAPEEL